MIVCTILCDAYYILLDRFCNFHGDGRLVVRDIDVLLWAYSYLCLTDLPIPVLHSGFIAFTTIGYGDYTPTTPAGRSIFIVWAILGVGTLTILISGT